MINISQHLFLPRTNSLQGYYALSTGIFQPSSSVYSSAIQRNDVYNTFQLFGFPLRTKFKAVRLFDPLVSSEEPNYVGLSDDSGYVYPQLVRKLTTFTSSSFTFSQDGYFVLAVYWFELFDSDSLPVSSDTLSSLVSDI